MNMDGGEHVIGAVHLMVEHKTSRWAESRYEDVTELEAKRSLDLAMKKARELGR